LSTQENSYGVGRMRKDLNKKELHSISRASFSKCHRLGLKHARENLPFIKHTIFDIKKEMLGPARSGIVFSAGPSVHIKNPAKEILDSGYKGSIICADGALYYCLRKGIVPDYVVSVDPDPKRIIRLFGDPELKTPPKDDYFRRQDLDPALNTNEVERNEEIMYLVNKHGKRIKIITSTSVTPKITRRCLEAGMKIYWWNPIYDDYDDQKSFTRKLFDITKVPCMATGGNVGTSGWVFAASILRLQNIALVGMDLSYSPDTPLYKTQYYHELKEIFKDRIEDGFIKIYNPYLKETWYTDPAYYWYRESFLGLTKLSRSVTFNCTEGGILFGKNVKFTKLKSFLKKFKK